MRELLRTLGVIVVLWFIGVVIFAPPSYILPSPVDVADKLFGDGGADLAYHALWTAVTSILGLGAALAVAAGLAALIARFPGFITWIMPAAVALKSTPIIVVAPILFIWFGTGLAKNVASSALVSFFPLLVGILRGMGSATTDEKDFFRSCGASRFQLLRYLQIPRSMPHFFAALKVAATLAVVGAVVGEFLGSNRGLGYAVVYASYHVETALVFAAAIYAAAVGLLLFVAVCHVDRRIVAWERPPLDDWASSRKIDREP